MFCTVHVGRLISLVSMLLVLHIYLLQCSESISEATVPTVHFRLVWIVFVST